VSLPRCWVNSSTETARGVRAARLKHAVNSQVTAMCRAASRSQGCVRVTVVQQKAQNCWNRRDRNGGCRTPLRARGQSCWFSSAENTPQKQVSTVSHPVDVTSSCDFRRRPHLIPITWLTSNLRRTPAVAGTREETWDS